MIRHLIYAHQQNENKAIRGNRDDVAKVGNVVLGIPPIFRFNEFKILTDGWIRASGPLQAQLVCDFEMAINLGLRIGEEVR